MFPALVMGFALILNNSCKKDTNGIDENDGLDTTNIEIFGHRIISEKYYSSVLPNSEKIFTYSANKLSRITYTSDINESAEYLLEYPDGNKIIVTCITKTDSTINERKNELKLVNNRVVEIIHYSEGYMAGKTEFIYKNSGLIESVKEYYYNKKAWDLHREETFVYFSGQLTQRISINNYTSSLDYKYEYSYKGNEINEIVEYNKGYSGSGAWNMVWKNVFTYTAGKITEIQNYDYIVVIGWDLFGNEEFKYDDNGNLVEHSEFTHGDVEPWQKSDFTYEAGSGNFRQIYGIIDDWFPIFPIPNLPSPGSDMHMGNHMGTQNTSSLMNLLGQHNRPGSGIGLYR